MGRVLRDVRRSQALGFRDGMDALGLHATIPGSAVAEAPADQHADGARLRLQLVE